MAVATETTPAAGYRVLSGAYRVSRFPDGDPADDESADPYYDDLDAAPASPARLRLVEWLRTSEYVRDLLKGGG